MNNASNSLINEDKFRSGHSKTLGGNDKDAFTPYKQMHDEDDQQYLDNLSEMHNISIKEAYEHECDVRKTIISSILLLCMATIIILVIVFREDIIEKMSDFMEIIKEHPTKTILIYFLLMTLMISASVPSAIPQVSGSYLFVQAFGFLKGLLVMIVVDYFSMLIGCVPPFLFARYLLKSCVKDYTSDKPKMMALGRALSKNAKKLVALMRCCALTPYVVFNIVCGITDMSVFDYCIGNLAIIFCDGPYIYICCSISKISSGIEEASTGAVIELIVIIISVIIVLGVAYYVYKIAQSEADKIMEQRRSSLVARRTLSKVARMSDVEAVVRLTSDVKETNGRKDIDKHSTEQKKSGWEELDIHRN
ncbi:unnamed protein product [Moneuplotes crassus]|uniref:VTT domain-containing protein n=1 Tax=Euplotes crassus TaxID=5936 RepID=A0AAD1XHV6_EUPCR|nr:unnamed protein product [Moneuplotes crassus]